MLLSLLVDDTEQRLCAVYNETLLRGLKGVFTGGGGHAPQWAKQIMLTKMHCSISRNKIPKFSGNVLYVLPPQTITPVRTGTSPLHTSRRLRRLAVDA